MNKIRKFIMLGAVLMAVTGAFAFKKFAPTTFFVDPSGTVVISGGGTTVQFTKIAADPFRSCKPSSGQYCEITHNDNVQNSLTQGANNSVTITASDYTLSPVGQAYLP